MAIEEALFSLLSGNPAVAVLVSTRIFGENTPEVGEPNDELPAIAYRRISTKRYYTMDTMPGAIVLAAPRFQFDCKAPDYDTAREVAQTIMAVMRGFRGVVSGMRIEGIFELDDRDDYNPQTKIYAVQKDFQVNHLE